MIEAWIWLTLIIAIPIGVVVLSLTSIGIDRLRHFAVGAAASLLVVSTGCWWFPSIATLQLDWWSDMGALFGPTALRVNALSMVLVPLAAGLWLLTVSVTPRARQDRSGQRRAALSTIATSLAFLTPSPILLLVVWIASVWTFLRAHSGAEYQHARRVSAVYLGLSTLLFGAGIVLHTMAETAEIGLWLITLAACIRKGIFPFHAWIPEGFEHGRIGPSLLFSAPQMGAYVTAVLVVPEASETLLRLVAVLALLTAVHAATLAVGQRDARRVVGYLFVSQSALVMAGLDCTSVQSLAGSLILWVSSALGSAGLGRSVLVLEARRGRLALDEYHGGYEQMPLLAASFLVMGLACMGFPGTLGFIGHEMILEGAIASFPVLGFCVIGASAFTGVAVLRMYFSLFCGRRDQGIQLGALPRETIAFAMVAALLLGLGVAPAPIAASGLDASRTLLDERVAKSEPPGLTNTR